MCGIAASFVCLTLGALFNNAAAALTGVMVASSERVASWPWASVEVPPWGAVECLAWYAAWGALFALVCRFWPRRVPFPRAWWRARTANSVEGTPSRADGILLYS